MDSGSIAAAAAWYAAGLSTVLAVVTGVRQVQANRTRLKANAYVTWDADHADPTLVLELVSERSPRPVHVRDCGLDKQTGGDTPEAGLISGYEVGDARNIVLPGQSWSEVIRPLPDWVDPSKPLTAWVRLVTGEEIAAKPIVITQEQSRSRDGVRKNAHEGRRCAPPPIG